MESRDLMETLRAVNSYTTTKSDSNREHYMPLSNNKSDCGSYLDLFCPDTSYNINNVNLLKLSNLTANNNTTGLTSNTSYQQIRGLLDKIKPISDYGECVNVFKAGVPFAYETAKETGDIEVVPLLCLADNLLNSSLDIVIKYNTVAALLRSIVKFDKNGLSLDTAYKYMEVVLEIENELNQYKDSNNLFAAAMPFIKDKATEANDTDLLPLLDLAVSLLNGNIYDSDKNSSVSFILNSSVKFGKNNLAVNATYKYIDLLSHVIRCLRAYDHKIYASKAFIPLIKNKAVEKGDTHLLPLLNVAGNMLNSGIYSGYKSHCIAQLLYFMPKLDKENLVLSISSFGIELFSADNTPPNILGEHLLSSLIDAAKIEHNEEVISYRVSEIKNKISKTNHWQEQTDILLDGFHQIKKFQNNPMMKAIINAADDQNNNDDKTIEIRQKEAKIGNTTIPINNSLEYIISAEKDFASIK